MKLLRVNVSALKYSFVASFIYVGLGTLGLVGVTTPSFSENVLLSLLIPIINLITMPVSFLGFSLLYGGGKESWPMVLIVQFNTFLAFWFISYFVRLGTARKIGKEKRND